MVFGVTPNSASLASQGAQEAIWTVFGQGVGSCRGQEKGDNVLYMPATCGNPSKGEATVSANTESPAEKLIKWKSSLGGCEPWHTPFSKALKKGAKETRIVQKN